MLGPICGALMLLVGFFFFIQVFIILSALTRENDNIYGAGANLPQTPVAGKHIVLDPGHGGVDLGAVGPTGLFEKEVSLDIAFMLRDLLQKGGARVYMTRETDELIHISDRVNFANQRNGDIFISIHLNAFVNGMARGIETFYYSNPEESSQLATFIQASLVDEIQLLDRDVKRERFATLVGLKMPGVLVEVAFITNPEEEALLRTKEFRYRAAEAIYRGILLYFDNDGG